MLKKSERDQLDNAWIAICAVRGALAGSLAIYMLVCKLAEDQLKPMSSGFSIETVKTALYVVTAVTLVGIFFIRKALLSVFASGADFLFGQLSSSKHPASGKIYDRDYRSYGALRNDWNLRHHYFFLE